MPTDSAALHRTILAVDVAGYNDPIRTAAHQLAVHEGLWGVLRTSFAEVGIPWDVCFVENTGDGAMIQLPPQVAKADLVAQLPERMLGELRRHNAIHALEAKIQLRVALHAGEVRLASHGTVSPATSFTFRLLEAPAAKSAMKQSGATLALIASETFYQDVVRQDPAAAADAYHRIRVETKETRTEAWLRLLGASAGAATLSVSAAAPTVTAQRDSFSTLVEALLAVACVRNAESRRVLLEMFPRREIAEAVPYHAEDRLHVISLARTCQRYAGGLPDLLAAVRLLEPQSPQVRELAEVIAARPDHPVS